jgi:hypothetical protein
MNRTRRTSSFLPTLVDVPRSGSVQNLPVARLLKCLRGFGRAKAIYRFRGLGACADGAVGIIFGSSRQLGDTPFRRAWPTMTFSTTIPRGSLRRRCARHWHSTTVGRRRSPLRPDKPLVAPRRPAWSTWTAIAFRGRRPTAPSLRRDRLPPGRRTNAPSNRIPDFQ